MFALLVVVQQSALTSAELDGIFIIIQGFFMFKTTVRLTPESGLVSHTAGGDTKLRR